MVIYVRRNKEKYLYIMCKTSPRSSSSANSRGARSSLADTREARSRSNNKGATTITAVTKCPCHTDSSTSYRMNPSVFNPAANLTNYSAGHATASLGKIQYLISNAIVGP